MTRPARNAGIPRPPSPAAISAAFAALGVYAAVPSADDLADQADAIGGDAVLAAVLANALYGAAIGIGMLAEGQMLAAGVGSDELMLARDQVLKASGTTGRA